MEEKTVFQKLESTQLEVEEVAGHRARLKQQLMEAWNGAPKASANPFSKALTFVSSALKSRQPVWLTAVASLLVVVLSTGIVFGTSTAAETTREAQCMAILQKNDAFMMGMGDDSVNNVTILQVEDGITMISVAAASTHAIVGLDLAAEKVSYYSINRRSFTSAEKTSVMEIMRDSEGTKALLDQGAQVNYMQINFASPAFYPPTNPTEAAAQVSLTLDKPITVQTNGTTSYKTVFNIWIDLIGKTVVMLDANLASSQDAYAEAFNILKADSEISDFFNRGAYINYMMSGTANGKIIALSAILKLGDQYYRADIDIVNQVVTWFGAVDSISGSWSGNTQPYATATIP